MDTEHKSEVKLENGEEIQRPSRDHETPLATMPTDEPAPEETASNSIELPFWKPDESDNVLTRAIHRQLIARYTRESPTWSPQMRSDMLAESKTLDYSVLNSTGVIGGHILHKRLKAKVTWPRFWTLRVLFGPAACARQTWFPEVLERFPDFALKSGYTGMVPLNFQEVLELDEWVPPAPTLEKCGYVRVIETNRRAASMGLRRSKRKKGNADGVVSNTTASTAAFSTTRFTLQRSPETDGTEDAMETPAAMGRQSMIPPDPDADAAPPPRDIQSRTNTLDMQKQLMELGDENLCLRQINAIQQRLIEQYQERMLRLETESSAMRRGRGE
ncbi:hypothetical protein ACQKWADRAFT_326631 [Trichoderma austrokoningii]